MYILSPTPSDPVCDKFYIVLRWCKCHLTTIQYDPLWTEFSQEIDPCLNPTQSELSVENICVIWHSTSMTHYGQWVSQEISLYFGSHPFRPCVWYKLSCLKMMQLSPDHHQVWPIMNRKSPTKWTYVGTPPLRLVCWELLCHLATHPVWPIMDSKYSR